MRAITNYYLTSAATEYIIGIVDNIMDTLTKLISEPKEFIHVLECVGICTLALAMFVVGLYHLYRYLKFVFREG